MPQLSKRLLAAAVRQVASQQAGCLVGDLVLPTSPQVKSAPLAAYVVLSCELTRRHCEPQSVCTVLLNNLQVQ
jgi:hypothetical protein